MKTQTQPVPTPPAPLMFIRENFDPDLFGDPRFFPFKSVYAGDIVRHVEGRTVMLIRVELIAKDSETAYVYGTVIKTVRGKRVTKGGRAMHLTFPIETEVQLLGSHDRVRRGRYHR